MQPLNCSIVATRSFIFATGTRDEGWYGRTSNVQIGFDPETKKVSVIHEYGCFSLFPSDVTFESILEAKLAFKNYAERSSRGRSEYSAIQFVPSGWESVTA